MFVLHETTRKHVCRWAFVLLCVLPTTATVVWAAYSHRPNRDGQWAASIGAKLHASAAVVGSDKPRPGRLRCRSVSLRDPALGDSLVDLFKVQTSAGKASLAIFVESAEVNANGLAALAQIGARWLAADHQPSELGIERAIVGHVGTENSAGQTAVPVEVRRVKIRTESTIATDRGAIRRLTISGRVAGANERLAPLVITAERWTQSGKPIWQTSIELNRTSLPATLLTGALPIGNALANANWSGKLTITINGDGTHGRMVGRFDDVRLDELMPPGSQHKAHGTASIVLDQWSWHDQRTERLSGTLQATNGSAAPSLLHEAADKLFCRVETGPTSVISPDHSNQIAFDQLGVRFEFDERGLTLSGACPQHNGVPRGCIAVASGRPMIMQPPYANLPIGNFVQFLLPPSTSWLPATQEAVDVARRWPLANVKTMR